MHDTIYFFSINLLKIFSSLKSCYTKIILRTYPSKSIDKNSGRHELKIKFYFEYMY